MKQKTELTARNLEFRRDTNKYLFEKYFNEKYKDYRKDIIDVLLYRDEKKRVLIIKKTKV